MVDNPSFPPATARPKPTRQSYAMPDGTLSALHFGRTANPLKLLFVHANGFNAASAHSFLDALGVHAVALDMRGHGFSDLLITPDNLPNWHVFRDDITYFAEHYIKAPVVMAGHSFGAVSLILAAPKLGPKMAGYVGFDPVIMPPLMRQFARLKIVRARMKKKLPIAAKAGRRRAEFNSLEAALESYRGRGAFAQMSDAVITDYLRGGLRPTDDGVRLACAPAWEQAIFCAQGHNTFAALKSMPAHSQIIFAGKHSPTPGFIQSRIARQMGAERVVIDDSLDHLFPMQQPSLAANALSAMLKTVALSPQPKAKPQRF